MSKVKHGWIKFYKCPKCENEKTTFVEYKDYIKLKCTKCKYVWKRGKKIMNNEEKEYIEHEIIDRLYCLHEEDFDKTKVDDSYIQAVIKAGKENKKLINKIQKENENAIWYVNQMIIRLHEDIVDYIDDDKIRNQVIISELKETKQQWLDVKKLLNGESKDNLYNDWRKFGEYE